MGRTQTLQVLLVDDNADIRQALCSILQESPDIQLVGEAANGEEAILAVEKLQPDVVLMDINIPALDGITATRRIKALYPEIAVVGLSANTPDYMVHSMIEAGAFAVMPKENAVEALHALIQQSVSQIPRDQGPAAGAAPPACWLHDASPNESEREASRRRLPAE